MILSHILGGLGNQMFQYAASRSLSLACDMPLRLDVSDFAGYGLHQSFELARVFSCPVTLAEPEDVRAVLGWQSSKRIRRIMARPELQFLRSRHLVVEPHFHYWPGIWDVSLPCYLMGYWQSERYFTGVTHTIRADFTFRQPLVGRNLELAHKIGTVNAVSLHIRRGDYASNPKTLAMHGMCSPAYYETAVRYIAERVEAPHFFVFSDDMDWVRANLNMKHPCCYVDHNRGAASYIDMQLMSLCRHHIIANSSFSWWGAWLNPRQDKIVVAPSRWFNNGKDTKDLLPENWVSV